jgi:hypothetical protein
MSVSEFYAYELKRKDTGTVFYVGKGSGNRYKSKRRNSYCTAVANKYGYEVNIVFRDPDEGFIFLLEQELIHKYKLLGIPLTNMTEGGEGMSGHIPSEETRAKRIASLKGLPKSAEHRMNLAKSALGRKVSLETKLKLSLVLKGKTSAMKGKKHTEAAKKKISEGITGIKNPFYGRTHTKESIALIREGNIGRKESDETRKRKSLSKMGKLNNRTGLPIPEEQKLRQIATLKARPRVTCPYCEKIIDEANAKRWHLDNCKEKR